MKIIGQMSYCDKVLRICQNLYNRWFFLEGYENQVILDIIWILFIVWFICVLYGVKLCRFIYMVAS